MQHGMKLVRQELVTMVCKKKTKGSSPYFASHIKRL